MDTRRSAAMIMALGVLAALAQDPSWTPEQKAQFKLARGYNRPDQVDEAAEAAGLSSPKFETRYAALLVRIHRTLGSGRGFENLHKTVLAVSADGGPPAAAAHLKALAESLRKSLACGSCEGAGKLVCAACKGKGRRDVPCKDCMGEGRTKPPGVLGNSTATVKCRNCDGQKFFKNVRCPDCKEAGKEACKACKGEPWPENRCQVKECQYGRVPCAICRGTCKEKKDCTDCEKGRARASGAVGKANVTVKCRTCEKPDGTHGDGTITIPCKTCASSGRATCKACGGSFGRPAASVSSVSAAAVLGVETCGDCKGAGWPERGAATPCAGCLGLGVLVLPKTDPVRLLK